MNNIMVDSQKMVLTTGRNMYLAGLGVAATVNDQYEKMISKLVEKGRGTVKEEDVEADSEVHQVKISDRVKEFSDKVGDKVQDGFTAVLGRFGIPSHKEIQALTLSIEQLTKKVQSVQPKDA